MPPSKNVAFQPRYGWLMSGKTHVVRAAVVAGEHHQRVVLETVLPQRVEHLPHGTVERADHRGVDALGVVRDAWERVVVGAQGLQRRVRRVERQIEEEGAVPVGRDRPRRFLRQVVGHVGARREARASILRHGEGQVRPQETVDGVERLPGLDHRGSPRSAYSDAPARKPSHSSKPCASGRIAGDSPRCHLPRNSVRYPRPRSSSARVTSSRGRPWSASGGTAASRSAK